MNELRKSEQRLVEVLTSGELSDPGVFADAVAILRARRGLDLSSLTPAEQAAAVAARTDHLLPGPDDLADRIRRRAAEGKGLHVKFGIDPTSPDVHIGHAVPIILMSLFQRLGHDVTLIVGDVTASIGDPSGRTDERPSLTEDDIAANLATYQEQIGPFFDFSRATFRRNGEWLREWKLVDLLPLLARVPASQAMQRDDFRQRLAEGHSLTMAEVMYSVVMALDSVELECDVEVGGTDQLLNLQMCRALMTAAGQEPEIVCTVQLIEGIDGSGDKMSKSRGNHVALTDPPSEIYGRVMSVPDSVMPSYFAMLCELTEAEIAVAVENQPPNELKHLLATVITETIAGPEAAAEARASFLARFRDRRLASATDLPTVPLAGDASIAALLTDVLEFAPSRSHVRRVADQGGLRLVRERSGEQPEKFRLDKDAVDAPVGDAVAAAGWEPGDGAAVFLQLGRQSAELV